MKRILVIFFSFSLILSVISADVLGQGAINLSLDPMKSDNKYDIGFSSTEVREGQENVTPIDGGVIKLETQTYYAGDEDIVGVNDSTWIYWKIISAESFYIELSIEESTSNPDISLNVYRYLDSKKGDLLASSEPSLSGIPVVGKETTSLERLLSSCPIYVEARLPYENYTSSDSTSFEATLKVKVVRR